MLINFWATWCGPCREEIPELIALQKYYGDRLTIIGLSVDDPVPETPPLLRQFADEHHINYTVALATPEVVAAFGGIPSVPTTFIVNADGGIVQRHRSILEPRMTEHEIRVLDHLPSMAQVVTEADQGQILSENAPPVDDVPELKLSTLTDTQRKEALRRLNSETLHVRLQSARGPLPAWTIRRAR